MKNIPQKIYLQIGDDCPNDADFKMLEGVRWCTEREFNNDIPFVLQPAFPTWSEAIEKIDDSRFTELPGKYQVCEGARIMYDRLYVMLKGGNDR